MMRQCVTWLQWFKFRNFPFKQVKRVFVLLSVALEQQSGLLLGGKHTSVKMPSSMDCPLFSFLLFPAVLHIRTLMRLQPDIGGPDNCQNSQTQLLALW